ncbi:MAG: hypothetical protein AAB250_14520 [Bdellovibrionota bacterium]
MSRSNSMITFRRLLLVTAIAFAAVLSSTSSQAQQRPMSMSKSENVRGITLKNITPFINQHVTFFYVLATKPLISVNERQINVAEVRYLVTKPVTSAVVTVPPLKLAVAGFRPGFNFVAVVFHAQPNYIWTNADGEIPVDPRGLTPQATATIPTHIMTFSKAQIEALAARQGNPETITIEL